jgi:hypothetical protein
MDDMPLDFTAYLSERLGLNESETNAILASWLKEYEPLCVGADERATLASRPLASTSAPAPEVRQSA